MGSTPGKMDSSHAVLYRRRAHHAGSWYSDDRSTLHSTLARFLQDAAAGNTASNTVATGPTVRAIVSPHAGFSYSGPTAAYAYSALQQELLRRHQQPNTATTTIVVLHPSHHVYLQGCAVSGASVLETPVGDLPVNDSLRREIMQWKNTTGRSSLFRLMTRDEDEHEHSGEMQYPYLAQILPPGMEISVLPIMCGALSTQAEAVYGAALALVLARPDVLTVVSTDFCHWGRRFAYQPIPPPSSTSIPIHEFIQQMDQQGMDLIAQDWQRPGAFAEYLRATKNTVCGRHALGVWLQALAATYPPASMTNDNNASLPNITFVKYAQSSAAKTMQDSSVSYAAAVCTL